MKKIFILLAFILIYAGCNDVTQNVDDSTCETEKFTPIASIPNAATDEEKIVGSWKWVQTVRETWSDTLISTPENSDSSCFYTFAPDSVFKNYPNGCLSKEGKYSFAVMGLPSDSIYGIKIINEIYMYSFFGVQADTLLIRLDYRDIPYKAYFTRVTSN